MTKLLLKNGTLTITYTKTDDSDAADEETLVFWLFKVSRQFGLIAEIENEDGDVYEQEETITNYE